MLFQVFFIVQLIVSVCGIEIDNYWVNNHYTRAVDLKKSFIKENVLIEAKNIHDAPVDSYYFTIPDGFDGIGEIAAFSSLLDDKMVLDYEQIGEKSYKLKLPIPLAPKSLVNLSIKFVYLIPLTALPSKLEMSTVQSLLIKLNKYNYSPYTTDDYTLLIDGLNKGQEMDLYYAKDLFQSPHNTDVPPLTNVVENKSLKYGPAKDIKPYSVVPMGLMYDHNKPLGKVTTLERSIWLPSSDINEFQIEEYYEVTNVGAELKGGFSRVEWLKGKFETIRNHWALSHLEYPMNDDLQFDDYYFTDKVGMVTTHKKLKNILLFEPRFPLFGGWKYNFTFGFNQHFDNHLKKLDGDTYILKVPLLNSPMDLTYENVNVNFYLPENSEFLNISSPVEFNSIVTDHEKSYLDVSEGHNKITVNFENLFDDLSKVDIFVTYKYTKANYWWKIVKISGFVFTGLISYYLLSLIDLSI